MSTHPRDELPALLTGDLSRAEHAGVVTHLRQCDPCRRALVTIAATTGALHASAGAANWHPAGAALAVEATGSGAAPSRADDGAGEAAGTGADPAPADDGAAGTRGTDVPRAALPPLRVTASRRSGWRRQLARPRLAVAAAAVVIAAATAGVLGLDGRSSPARQPNVPVQTAALSDPSGRAAAGPSGSVTLRLPGSRSDLTVATRGLALPGPGEFYEVWLFDPRTLKMVGVGVLPPDGRATFRIPAELAGAYRAVDISLQRDNGDPRHSTRSVLRGRYS